MDDLASTVKKVLWDAVVETLRTAGLIVVCGAWVTVKCIFAIGLWLELKDRPVDEKFKGEKKK